MKDRIIYKLKNELGYSDFSAEKTAADLMAIQHKDLRRAFFEWLNDGTIDNIFEGSIGTFMLMEERGMTFPAALIMLDWLREDKETALSALDIM